MHLLTMCDISHIIFKTISESKNMTKFKIETYVQENGNNPVKEFIFSLDEDTQSKLVHLIELLEEKGNQLREPYSKSISDGIFELRYQNKKQPTRILYFFYHEGRIILTNGFVKKSRKAPRKEIKLALKYKKDFLERQQNEG